MKTVTLFRHAKSGSKDNPDIKDFDRPLSRRGLKAAPKMGEAMRDRKLEPDLILCSPSLRTRQTLTLAEPEAWNTPPEVRFDEKLYEASPQTLLKTLKALPKNVAHVMIVGHNPGLQDLAASLAPAGSSVREEFKEGLPTASVASFDFNIDDWAKLRAGTGQLQLFISPNKLGDSPGKEK